MYRVLIVEDEDIIRNGLIYMVNWLQLNCTIVGKAVDGVQGLAKIKELTPDIVITDIKMPFKDGIQMLAESKEKYNYEAIIISGHSEFEYAKQAISLSVSEYLLKPVNFDELRDTIHRLTAKVDLKNRLKTNDKSYEYLHLYRELLDVSSYQSENYKSKYVSQMLEYIKENYAQKITLSDLSKKFHVSTVYLNSKFKEATHYTFNDFLIRYRIMKAIELLRQEDLLIYEIAEQVGFQDYKYFSQVFKKYVGTSPTSFMEDLM